VVQQRAWRVPAASLLGSRLHGKEGDSCNSLSPLSSTLLRVLRCSTHCLSAPSPSPGPCPSALQGFTDIAITYSSPRGDDLDSRLLRAMVIKGILENNTTANVNLVNADLLAKNRGIRISEVTVRSDGR
jgi:hypothetical protein